MLGGNGVEFYGIGVQELNPLTECIGPSIAVSGGGILSRLDPGLGSRSCGVAVLDV
jgi:hypothetical protein